MAEFKKYTLVPTEKISKHMTSPQQISDLDQEMGKILNNRQLTDDEKVLQYYQLLQQKFKMQEFNKGVSSHPIQVQSGKEEEEEIKIRYEDIILQSVPIPLKKHANTLLSFLKSHSQVVRWNEKGEVFIRDTLIPQSNIVDLINMLLRATTRNIVGKEPFLQVLSELNMPQHFNRNPHLLKDMVTSTSKDKKDSVQNPKEKRKIKKEDKQSPKNKKTIIPRTNKVRKSKRFVDYTGWLDLE